jgi:hypothetical protein
MVWAVFGAGGVRSYCLWLRILRQREEAYIDCLSRDLEDELPTLWEPG